MKNFTGNTSLYRLAHLSKTEKTCIGFSRHVFSILFMHFFITYCSRYTYQKRELSTDVTRRIFFFFAYLMKFLLRGNDSYSSMITNDQSIIQRTSFHIIKLLLTTIFLQSISNKIKKKNYNEVRLINCVVAAWGLSYDSVIIRRTLTERKSAHKHALSGTTRRCDQ